MIHCDFETRSIIDLRKIGIYPYARHPTTSILCLGWAVEDDEVDLWLPGMPPPKTMIEAINDGLMIAAWNAQFERMIWNWKLTQHGFPPLPVERFYCLAALSRARGFPGALDKAARFAEMPYQKDMEGHRLMLKLCKPRRIEENGTIIWWNHKPDYDRLGDYCKQDVVVERAFSHYFIPFTDQELSDYHLSEHINDHGVHVDIDLARAAVEGVEKEKIDASHVLDSITGGKVTAHTQVAQIREWVENEWKALPDLNKTTVQDALLEDDIPPHVADVLEIRLENSRAAVAKFKAILDRHVDGVLYGLYIFHGVHIGRFSSFGLQIQNLIAETNLEGIPILKKHGIKGLAMLGDVIAILAQMVRPAFMAAPGKTFLIGDYSQIEARIVAWLAGEEKLLKLFREGVSPYSAFGTKVLGREVSKHGTPKEYKVFKACILGLGFGGAEGALARGTKKEKIILSSAEQTEYVQAYRSEYTNIKAYWYKLKDTIMMAMLHPGEIQEIGIINYLFDGEHLWCRLPSGRLICYPFAKIVTDEFGDSVEYRRGNRAPKAGVSEWPTTRLWHGAAIENLAQAIAFDLLMAALRRLRNWDIPIHVHDELVPEVPKDQAEKLLPEFLSIMCELPEWAEGLPIAAEGQISERYQK